MILQLDWAVGPILDTLERLELADRTLVIFTSDNGPVVDDGYRDQAVEKLGGTRPSRAAAGRQVQRVRGGTRVPMIVRWPGRVKPGVSDALVGQVDFLASFAALRRPDAGPGGRPRQLRRAGRAARGLPDRAGRLVEQAGALSLVAGRWKLISPSEGRKVNPETNTELGNDPQPQLYDLSADLGERRNVAGEHPEVVRDLTARLTGSDRTVARGPDG